MMQRRTVIVGVSTAVGVSLSGCLASLSDDENVGEAVEKYENAYSHNARAVEYLEEGIDSYRSSDYTTAEIRFEDAEDQFATAEQELPSIELVAETGSEEALDILVEDTAVLSGAQVAAGHSAQTARSQQGETMPGFEPGLEEVEQDLQSGEFLIPDPETFESAF